MKIAIRMDDITPDMDWNAFYRVKEILEREEIKPLLGIVPDNKDSNLHKCQAKEDFWEQMRRLQSEGWCMALHGMHHIYTTNKGGLFPLNHFSEYAGVAYEKQEEMIRRGKEILEKNGIHTDIFMAPGHSYDLNTLRALKNNGFTKVTDGFGETPYFYKGITFYPISFRMEQTLKKTSGYSTMVLHANTMTEEDFRTLEIRVTALKKEGGGKLISYSDYLEVPAISAGVGKRIIEWALASMKNFLVLIKGMMKK